GEGEGEGEGPSGGCPAGTIGPPSSGALPGLRGDAIVLSLGFSAILVAGKRVAVVRHAPFHGRG
ncbi:MAG: hypothetical protein GWP08_17030, partial [Nitrospiraceae bacterium]|nr:hypothetical protein [Nitrospiraceae bacterium]